MTSLGAAASPVSILVNTLITITEQPGDLCLIPFKDTDSKIKYVNYHYDLEKLDFKGLSENKSGHKGIFYSEDMPVGFKVGTNDADTDKYHSVWYITKGYKITMDPDVKLLLTASIEKDLTKLLHSIKKLTVNKDGSITIEEEPANIEVVVGSPCFILQKELNDVLSQDAEKIKKLMGTHEIELKFNYDDETSS